MEYVISQQNLGDIIGVKFPNMNEFVRSLPSKKIGRSTYRSVDVQELAQYMSENHHKSQMWESDECSISDLEDLLKSVASSIKIENEVIDDNEEKVTKSVNIIKHDKENEVENTEVTNGKIKELFERSDFRIENKLRSFEDIHVGRKLVGRVVNMIQDAAFVEIGLVEQAYLHVSDCSTDYQHLHDVNEFVHYGQMIFVTVVHIDPIARKFQVSIVPDHPVDVYREKVEWQRSRGFKSMREEYDDTYSIGSIIKLDKSKAALHADDVMNNGSVIKNEAEDYKEIESATEDKEKIGKIESSCNDKFSNLIESLNTVTKFLDSGKTSPIEVELNGKVFEIIAEFKVKS